MSDKISLLGYGIDAGQRILGPSIAPSVIRSFGLNQFLEHLGWNCDDLGDVIYSQFSTHHCAGLLEQAFHLVANRVASAAYQNRVQILMGGDHSMSIATIYGLLKANPSLGVVWVDAHGDINTPNTSPTSNFHGMPLAALLGLFNLNWQWFEPLLPPRRLVYIGVRDLDKGELEFIKRLNIKMFTAQDVRRLGMKKCALQAMTYLEKQGANAFHLSFDIDSLDPKYAPSTGVPVLGGLTPDNIWTMGQIFSQSQGLNSLDLVELNPLIAKCDQELSKTVYSVFLLLKASLNRESEKGLFTVPSIKINNVVNNPFRVVER